jgi:hypothetical protein
MSSSSNPFESTDSKPQPNNASTNSETAYNVVTDLVTGVNVRSKDNAFQAIFIACSVLVLAGLGALAAYLNPSWKLPAYGGAIIGAILGLVFGLFASGIFLMIYRAVRHLQGKHD